MSASTEPTTEDKDLDALKAEFDGTHNVWRGRVGDQPEGGWYATLRRAPRPDEVGRLYPTVSADTFTGLHAILAKQAALAEQGQP